MAVGIEAQKQKLRFQILEKDTLANSIYHYPRNMRFFSSADKLEIGNVPFVSQMPKPNRDEALEYYRRVCMHFDLPLRCYTGVHKITKSPAGHFELQTTRSTMQAQNVCMATGFYDAPRLMEVPGEDLPKVQHYYSEAHPYYGQDLAIVGAANSAIDAALECWRKGAASVSLIVRQAEISPRVKYWVRPDIINRIEEASITAYYEAAVERIDQESITILHRGERKTLRNDFVLALTGYQPNFSLLEAAGVEFHNEGFRPPVYNPQTMESNVAGLYLAGVVCGGLETHKWFIENSRAHAPLITKDIAQKLPVKTAEV